MSLESSETERKRIIKNFRLEISERSKVVQPSFFNIDRDGTIIYITDTAKKFFLRSWRLNIDKGDNLIDIIPTDSLKEFTDEFITVLSSLLPGSILLSYKNLSHRFFLTPLFLPDGSMGNIQILISQEPVLHEVIKKSDRKKVEEESRIAKERYELVSKATREAVYDWDITNNTLDWSDSYYEIYGYDRIPLQKSLLQWEQQIHKEDRERVVNQMNSSLRGKDSEWTCEYKLIQADRKIAVVFERGYIIRDQEGNAIRMIGSLQDITTLKQNERALEELNYKLKKDSAKLSQSNAELEQFAYIASHDLQEPLRMVTSFLLLLEKKYENDLDEKARQYIHFASDGAGRMREIILDLLDYSRVGKLHYDLELVDMNGMIRNISRLYENLILEKNARIEFKNLPIIKAATTPLQRVLSNLISNSIKYSRKNVPPVIKISVKDIVSHWEFMVKDNGIGIDDRFKEKIFIIFQRLHSRDEYSGTGIGLAISKKIVENHGGKIWVDSKPGVGSTFHFTIQKHF